MIAFMPKETRLNLRISDSFREQLEALAEYRGLTLSSLAHSLLVKALRQERLAEPEAFALLTDHSNLRSNRIDYLDELDVRPQLSGVVLASRRPLEPEFDQEKTIPTAVGSDGILGEKSATAKKRKAK